MPPQEQPNKKQPRKKRDTPRQYRDHMAELENDPIENAFGVLIYRTMKAKGIPLSEVRKAGGFHSGKDFYPFIYRHNDSISQVLRAINGIAYLLELNSLRLTVMYCVGKGEAMQALILNMAEMYQQLPEMAQDVYMATLQSLYDVYINRASK